MANGADDCCGLEEQGQIWKNVNRQGEKHRLVDSMIPAPAAFLHCLGPVVAFPQWNSSPQVIDSG